MRGIRKATQGYRGKPASYWLTAWAVSTIMMLIGLRCRMYIVPKKDHVAASVWIDGRLIAGMGAMVSDTVNQGKMINLFADIGDRTWALTRLGRRWWKTT